jgi:hypothetical protein
MTVPQPDSLRVYLGAVLVLLNRGAVSAGDTSRNANPNAACDHSTAGESSRGCVNGVSSSHGNFRRFVLVQPLLVSVGLGGLPPGATTAIASCSTATCAQDDLIYFRASTIDRL